MGEGTGRAQTDSREARKTKTKTKRHMEDANVQELGDQNGGGGLLDQVEVLVPFLISWSRGLRGDTGDKPGQRDTQTPLEVRFCPFRGARTYLAKARWPLALMWPLSPSAACPTTPSTIGHNLQGQGDEGVKAATSSMLIVPVDDAACLAAI